MRSPKKPKTYSLIGDEMLKNKEKLNEEQLMEELKKGVTLENDLEYYGV